MLTIRDLWRVRDIINIQELARRVLIPPNTLHTRIRRQTELSVELSARIEQVLNDIGITIHHRPKKKGRS